MPSNLSQARRQRRAAVVVETTFVVLIAFVFLYAVFEYGRAIMMRQIMENAARTGARTAVTEATSYITSASANSSVQNAVTQALAGQSLQNLNIQVYLSDNNGNNIGDWTTANFGDLLGVQIDADMPLLFAPFNFLPNNGGATNSLHLTTRTVMRSEAN
jgi:Flp pilus assembly protein TadG